MKSYVQCSIFFMSIMFLSTHISLAMEENEKEIGNVSVFVSDDSASAQLPHEKWLKLISSKKIMVGLYTTGCCLLGSSCVAATNYATILEASRLHIDFSGTIGLGILSALGTTSCFVAFSLWGYDKLRAYLQRSYELEQTYEKIIRANGDEEGPIGAETV